MGMIPAESAARRSAVRWVMVAVALVVVVADQVSKSLILATHAVAAGNGWIVFRLVRNTGASGGIASGHPVLVTLTGALITALAVTLAVRVRDRGVAICLAAVCGGALGNLSDRIFRAPGFGRGAVVDWIHVAGRGGSFNVADTAIQFGVIAAIIAMFVAERGRRAALRAAEAAEQAGESWPGIES
ncbi:MAG TPA: signal peptidase II [Trebonia sp.]|jgi:signal peptidase II|nr:signal peptidase II [Trebonia sp.]